MCWIVCVCLLVCVCVCVYALEAGFGTCMLVYVWQRGAEEAVVSCGLDMWFSVVLVSVVVCNTVLV